MNDYGHPLPEEHVMFENIESITEISTISDYRLGGNYITFTITCYTVNKPLFRRHFEIKMTDRIKLDVLYERIKLVVRNNNNKNDALIGL